MTKKEYLNRARNIDEEIAAFESDILHLCYCLASKIAGTVKPSLLR